MNPTNYQVRRATVDDLVVLRRLWQQARLPVAALEKRLTEFQVVETADGDLLGALGLRIEQQHGEIHSEALRDQTLADDLRLRLWERVQSVARNYGLVRLWTGGTWSEFWMDQGFKAASEEARAKRPSTFTDTVGGPSLTLKLREEHLGGQSLDAELELFRLARQEESERVLRQARLLRLMGRLIAAVLVVLVGLAAFYLIKRLQSGAGP